jgi:predicted glycoside hydrolase/deacetylase ChbG (UPF0249 family)
MDHGEKRLIITADDYGLCEPVNRAIEECLAAATVRATCVMANMSACDAARELRKSYPYASIGIHWNVTQGRPVLSPAKISTLVDAHGVFYRSSELRRRWWLRKVKRDELEAELGAQFERLNGLVGTPDFWNTHQNVHVFPGLFTTFVSFAEQLGVRAMRSHRRLTVPCSETELNYHLKHPRYWIKGQVISWWSSRAAMRGAIMPDARAYAPGYQTPEQMIEEVARRVPWHRVKSAVEVAIHPATEIVESLFGSLTQSRLAEYGTFKNPMLKKRLQGMGVETVGFEALWPPVSSGQLAVSAASGIASQQ